MMTKKFKGFGKRICSIFLCMAMLCTMTPAAFAGNFIDADGDGANDYLDTAYAAAAEGAVLLENDGTLPFDADSTTVAVFGRGQIDLVKGGYGSGDVNVLESQSYNFIEGMEEVGISYYAPLYQDYAAWCAANPPASDNSRPKSEPEMPLTDAQVDDAAAGSDLAVVIIRRNAGESSDRSTTQGDWYLTDLELDLLEKVNGAFDDIVVILNVGGLMDLAWVDDYENISSILLAWQPGNYGSIAIADILIGNVTPSGRMSDTWAYRYEDYPASIYGTFGVTATSVDDDSYVDPIYGEDIYVGYRYFETFNPDAVQYEFGYGQSYTTFSQEITDFSVAGDEITVSVQVTNTGDTYSGKDVVQVYYSAPQGVLGKAAYELAAYGKTDELAPGQSQVLSITYNIPDMASYDDSGATGNESCYVLEAGEYVISAGSSVKRLEEAGTYTVDTLTVTETLTELVAPTYSFDILTTGSQNADGTYQPATTGVALRDAANDKSASYDGDLPWVELTGEDAGIRLIEVATGSGGINDYMAQYTLEELVTLFGGQSGTTSSATTTANNPYLAPGAYGAAGSMMQLLVDNDDSISWGVSVADGPAGLRLGIDTDDTGNTAFPIGLMLACTWNLELVEQVGEAIGRECVANDVDIWLAPALNIHRDPLCGRNYEYYSEDPVVSGTMAAAATKGVQSQGIGVAVKHFAANQQELNRSGGNSIVSERALREIYLTGFEIVVKTSNPWYFMTAYNKLNGYQTATDYELNTLILREEWGFEGTVMTDWSGRKDAGNSSMLRAQNDISMPLLTGGNGGSAAPGAINLYGYVTTGDYTITTDGAAPNGETPEESTNTIDVTDIDLADPAHQAYEIYSYNSSSGAYTPVNTVGGWLGENDAASRAAILQKVLDAGYAIQDDSGNPIDVNAVVAAVDDGYRAYNIYEVDTDPDDPGLYVYKYLCTLDGWLTDTSDIITGVVDGRLTMGEIQRCATNLLNSTIQSYNFRAENGLGAAEYTYDESAAVFTVRKSDVSDTIELFTITGSANTGGSAGSATVAAGEDAEIEIVADEGYKLIAILLNGVTVDISDVTDGTYVIYNVREDITLRALFVPDQEEAFAAVYSDVSTIDERDNPTWYYDPVDILTGLGVMEGVGDGLFDPERSMTRSEFAQIVFNLADVLGMEVLEADDVPFEDLPAEDYWAYGVLGWAYSEGLIEGYNGDGTEFGPEDDIIREDMAVLMERFFAEFLGYDLPGNRVIAFDDAEDIDDWAEGAVTYVVRTGLMQGMEDNTFRPVSNTRRCEVAQVFWNYLIYTE